MAKYRTATFTIDNVTKKYGIERIELVNPLDPDGATVPTLLVTRIPSGHLYAQAPLRSFPADIQKLFEEE